jgi:5-methylcytosine-specific restriction endonuclease McrA
MTQMRPYVFFYYDDVGRNLYIGDNGTGMTPDTIVKHWMTIGLSTKKKSFISNSGRIQTGAKGIGRFALDRIADQCVFHHMCGYCGKHEMVSHRGMEPDHFVPNKTDASRKCDYSNLVYSCFTCNRKKLNKWPTLDKDKSHDGHIGFVDPATPEFDTHLGRNKAGAIEYYTDVGEYMFKIAFKFDIRPTKAIWQASQLYELTDKLEIEISKKPQSDKDKYISMMKDKYISMMIELHELQGYLFDKKE